MCLGNSASTRDCFLSSRVGRTVSPPSVFDFLRASSETEMAETEARQPDYLVEEEEKVLKYLHVFQAMALYYLLWLMGIYLIAKESLGPLKSGVETVEGTVTTVLGPVYDKLQHLPFKLLKFVDRKVEKVINILEPLMPSPVRQASSRALSVAEGLVREAASEVDGGAVTVATRITKSVCAKYEPIAEQYAAWAWSSLNRLPLFPQVAQVAVPTAAYWADKYNGVVGFAAGRGYRASNYLPLVPVERIAKVFGRRAESAPTVSTNGGAQ